MKALCSAVIKKWIHNNMKSVGEKRTIIKLNDSHRVLDPASVQLTPLPQTCGIQAIRYET